jgi:hypothetical protein
LEYFANKYIQLVKNTPMFMNSPNKDKSDPQNNEYGKFPIVDRYMSNARDWATTLGEIEKTQKTVKWENKQDKIYWRGSTSGMN